MNREIVSWFECDWCKDVLHVVVKTSFPNPLLRHIDRCNKRPAGYKLPEVNLYLENRLDTANAAHCSGGTASNDACAVQKSFARRRWCMVSQQFWFSPFTN